MYNFKNKQANLNQYNNYLLAKTLSMFEYENLPDSLPYQEIEKRLQTSGYVFITKHEGELYAFTGGLGGEPDVYGNPTTIIISNSALGINKTFDIETDGVLIRSDDSMMGLLPLFNRSNSFLVENDINMLLHGYNSRMQSLLSAGDDKTKASAEIYLTKLVDGELGIIGESALFDGIKTHTAGKTSQGNSITSLTEFHQYIKGSLFHEIGLSANFNMKRERLTANEVGADDDVLYPFIDNMMKCRLKGIEKLNEMFGLSILIEYGSVWNRKNKEMVDDIITAENNSNQGEALSNNNLLESSSNLSDDTLPESVTVEPLDESLNESLDESLNESTDESTDESLNEPLEVQPEQDTDESEVEPVLEVEPEAEAEQEDDKEKRNEA